MVPDGSALRWNSRFILLYNESIATNRLSRNSEDAYGPMNPSAHVFSFRLRGSASGGSFGIQCLARTANNTGIAMAIAKASGNH